MSWANIHGLNNGTSMGKFLQILKNLGRQETKLHHLLYASSQKTCSLKRCSCQTIPTSGSKTYMYDETHDQPECSIVHGQHFPLDTRKSLLNWALLYPLDHKIRNPAHCPDYSPLASAQTISVCIEIFQNSIEKSCVLRYCNTVLNLVYWFALKAVL